MTFQLRPYQSKLIELAREALVSGRRSVLIQSPTGSGKTALTACMLGAARRKGKRSWFIVHRRELVKQSAAAFDLEEIPYGIVAAGFRADLRQLVQVCSIQTLVKRLHLLHDPDLIVWDECQHCASKSWASVHDRYQRSRHIGLTATPERLDGRGLSDYFETMVVGPSVSWLIENSYLAGYKYYAPTTVNLDDVKTLAGDYKKDQLSVAMDTPTITGDAVDHYLRLAKGKRAVVFAVSREHSRHIAGQFAAAGVPSEHVDGDTPTDVRDAAVARFTSGKTLVLTNVELFGEGFDLPAIEVAILLRPTQSLALYLQQVGRALRPSPGKDHATILDHAGNVRTHGLPDDPREWSLISKSRSKRGIAEPKINVRLCPKCYAAMPSATSACFICGHVFEIESRQVSEVEGELQEMSKEQIEHMRRERRKQQGKTETLDDLVRLGISRGYKHPLRWAEYVIAGRQRKQTA